MFALVVSLNAISTHPGPFVSCQLYNCPPLFLSFFNISVVGSGFWTNRYCYV